MKKETVRRWLRANVILNERRGSEGRALQNNSFSASNIFSKLDEVALLVADPLRLNSTGSGNGSGTARQNPANP